MVLAHVEVFEALDAWVIEGYQLFDQAHIYLALLYMKLLLVENSQIHVLEATITASWGIYANQSCLTAVRTLQEFQMLIVQTYRLEWSGKTKLPLRAIDKNVVRQVARNAGVVSCPTNTTHII